MRRKDKEVANKTEIDDIISQSRICRLGLSKNDIPYIVPLSFGYDGENVYLHTANEGRKIDYIESNNRVCLEFETEVALVENEALACKWGFLFKSAICEGKIEEIKDAGEAIEALNSIMLQYSDKKWEINRKMLNSVRIWKVKIEHWSGKISADRKSEK